MDSSVYRLGAVPGGLLVGKANTLTLLFVIVFPGLAVVRLAALRLALLACAKNTKAVRPSRFLPASAPSLAASRPCSLLSALTHSPPGPHAAPEPILDPVAWEEGGNRPALGGDMSTPKRASPLAGRDNSATKTPLRMGLGRRLPLKGNWQENSQTPLDKDLSLS